MSGKGTGNGIKGRNALMLCGIDQRSRLSEQLRSPIRAEAVGHLAKDDTPAQRLLTGIIGRRNRLILGQPRLDLAGGSILAHRYDDSPFPRNWGSGLSTALIGLEALGRWQTGITGSFLDPFLLQFFDLCPQHLQLLP